MKKFSVIPVLLIIMLIMSIAVSAVDTFTDLEDAVGGKTILENPELIDGAEGNTHMGNVEGPEYLFEQVFSGSSKFTVTNVSEEKPWWVEWKYDKAYVVDRLILGTANDQENNDGRGLGDGWTFSGSSDGRDWKVIYTGTAADVADITNVYFYLDLPNNKDSYQYYKLYADAASGGVHIQYSQLFLTGTEPAAAPTPTQAPTNAAGNNNNSGGASTAPPMGDNDGIIVLGIMLVTAIGLISCRRIAVKKSR